MTIFGWFVWALTCLAFVMAVMDIFDGRRIVRIASRMISVCLIAALVTTAATDISKFHLLWFVPVVFFICRGIALSIVMNDVGRRAREILRSKEYW